MKLFGNSRLIDDDEWEWQLVCFKWLIQNTGGIDELRKHPLITPTLDFFPSTYADQSNQADRMFDLVKKHADMANWPVTLKAGESNKPNTIHPTMSIVHQHAPPLGTFQVQQDSICNNTVVITYNPDILSNMEAFIATMAHELSHYLMRSFNTLPPGGHEMEELATDLCAVFLGFGIFIANNAKVTDGFTDFDQQGWKIGYAGYLSEHALITALSISETLAGRDPMNAAKYLKPYLAKDLKKASKYIVKKDIYSEIMTADLSEYGDYALVE